MCVIIVGVGTIVTGLAGGLATLFVARLMVGMGEGPAFPAATQAMRNWYPPDRFGYIQGITHSASRLGAAIAPPIVTAIILWAGWRVAFVVCGAAALLGRCVVDIFRDDPRQHPSFDPGRLKNLGVSLPDRRAKIPLWLLTNRMFPVTIVMFAYGWTYWVFVVAAPLLRQPASHRLEELGAPHQRIVFRRSRGQYVGGIVSDLILKDDRPQSTGTLQRHPCFAARHGASDSPIDVLRRLTIVAILAAAMFFLELTIAPMYAIPMDISKEYAGLGSAYIIMGVALAGIVSPSCSVG